MPDRTYTLHYDASSADAAARAVDRLAAALTRLDGAAVRAAASVKTVGQGFDARAAGAAASATKAASAVLALRDAAANASGAVATTGRELAVAGDSARAASGRILSAAEASGRIADAMGAAAGKSREFAADFGALGRAARAGLGAAAGLAASMSDALRDSREFAKEAAEEVLKLEDSVRELRMTMGGGTTTAGASEAVQSLMLESGADLKDATAFNTMWESTVFAAKKKKNWGLNEEQTKDAKVQALRYAVASGMDAKTIGEVVPLIGVGEKVDSADDVLGKLGTMGRLAVEGVGNLTPLMKVYEKLRGTMVRPGGGGAFKTSEELMGAISAQSVNAGNVPAVTTAMNQIWRDLSFADNDTKKATFEKYGLKPGDDYQTRVNKIAPLVEGARAKGQTEAEALYEAGFHRTGTNPKIVQAVTERQILAENLDISRNARTTGAEVRGTNDQFRAEQPNRFATNAVTDAKLRRGREMKDLLVLRKLAEADATNNAGMGRAGMNFFENVLDLKIPGVVPFLGGKSLSQDLFGQESARERVLDAVTSGHILGAVPDAAKRFPNLSGQIDVPGLNRANPAFQPARGEELAEIVRNLTPEERKAVTERMERAARPRAARGPGGAAGAPGAGAGAAGAAAQAGPQASLDASGLTDVNRQQLRVLERIDRKLSPDAGASPRGGELPFGGYDFAPERIG